MANDLYIGEEMTTLSNKNATQDAGACGNSGVMTTLIDNKFEDVESLVKSYNSLQSEFTKRCQKIKELEGELESLRKPEKITDNAFEGLNVECGQPVDIFTKYPKATKYQDEFPNDSLGRDLTDDYIGLLEKKLDDMDMGILPEDIKQKVVKEYLDRVFNGQPKAVFLKSGGVIPTTPPHKPHTLEEANNLAKQILKDR